MKRWSSFVFIFIFTANAMAIALMGIWYMNDQDYFTDNFCVNKEKKEMQCNGRCHLQKQISGQKGEQNKEEISVPVLEFEYTCFAKKIVTKRKFTNYIQHYFFTSPLFYKAPHLTTAFHPPIA
jgi:hypothetical protein